MTRLSVIVISLNEGESLRRTVDNLLATLPDSSEIIVVDDGSTDQSTGFLSEGYAGVTLVRPPRRLGVAGARNFGASHANGDVLVFSDAHVEAPPGWADALLEVLARPEVGAVAPAISTMRPAAVECTGYGQKWLDASLAVGWLGQQSSAPYPVPLAVRVLPGLAPRGLHGDRRLRLRPGLVGRGGFRVEYPPVDVRV